MSLKFRKRIKLFPGCTINISKSGVSTTLCIKGLSVNVGKNGAYLNTGIPGTGIYDRTRIKESNSDVSYDNTNNKENEFDYYNNKKYDSIKSNNEDITDDVFIELKQGLIDAKNEKQALYDAWQESIKKRSSARSWQIFLKMLVIGFFMPSLQKDVDDAYAIEQQAEKVYKMFDYNFEVSMSSLLETKYLELIKKFDELSTCDRIWDVTNSRLTDSFKERTIDGTKEIIRKEVTFTKGKLDFINSKYDALIWGNANGGSLYFYPSFIVVYNGNIDNSSFIDYRNLDVIPESVNFHETSGYIPNDSEQIGMAYKYVNKDGSPDRRRNYNPKYPVLKYVELTLKTNKGLYEKYEFSSIEKISSFASAMANYLEVLLEKNDKKAEETHIENSEKSFDLNELLQKSDKNVKHGYYYIRDYEYDKASIEFDKVVSNNNNKDCLAYIGKILCEYKVTSLDSIIDSVELNVDGNGYVNNFLLSNNYKKALELAIETKETELVKYLLHIEIESIFNAAVKYYHKCIGLKNVNLKGLKEIKELLLNIENESCKERAKEIQKMIDELSNCNSNEKYDNVDNEKSVEIINKYDTSTDFILLIPIVLLVLLIVFSKEQYKNAGRWVHQGEQWLYTESGNYKVGLTYINGSYYYFDSNNNYMQTGLIELEDGKYYFGKDGGAHRGWVELEKSWYFCNNKGKMLTNSWIGENEEIAESNSGMFYVGSDGKMITGKTITINGKSYQFDSKGRRISVWKATNLYINTSANSIEYMHTINIYQPIYCHYTFESDIDNATERISCVIIYPNGSMSSPLVEEYSNGYTGYRYFPNGIYNNPQYGATGTLIFSFFDSKNKLIGQVSTEIVR